MSYKLIIYSDKGRGKERGREGVRSVQNKLVGTVSNLISEYQEVEYTENKGGEGFMMTEKLKMGVLYYCTLCSKCRTQHKIPRGAKSHSVQLFNKP